MTKTVKTLRDKMLNKLVALNACSTGYNFAANHPNASSAWTACREPAWLFWALMETKKINKVQGIQIGLALTVRAAKRLEATSRRRAATWKPVVDAVRKWLKNPNPTTLAKVQSLGGDYTLQYPYTFDCVERLAQAVYIGRPRYFVHSIYHITLHAPNIGLPGGREEQKELQWACNTIRRIVGNPYKNQ